MDVRDSDQPGKERRTPDGFKLDGYTEMSSQPMALGATATRPGMVTEATLGVTPECSGMTDHVDESSCLWCSMPFRPRASGGSRQRFCSKRCRRDFHDCARRWAIAEVDAGRLTPADLAKAPNHSINAALTGKLAQSGVQGSERGEGVGTTAGNGSQLVPDSVR